MRQNITGIATFCLFLIGLAGCAVTDVDKTVDFNRLQTYSWGESEIKVENPLYRGDLINKRIKHAVEDEFNRIGLRRDDKHPDFPGKL